jgi:rhodanese-related sulfurtransferase
LSFEQVEITKGGTMDAITLAARRADVLILDVRHPHEWEAGRIEEAVHIPLDELEARIDELAPDRPLVAVCRSGNRSTRAMELLRSKGFRAASLDGGMAEWAATGLPVVTPDGAPGSVADSQPPQYLPPDLAAVRDIFIEVTYALQERFGEREPTDEEARAFMLEWLVGKGRTPSEAAALLDTEGEKAA